MDRTEIITLTDKWLKSVPEIRKRLRLMDKALKRGDYDLYTIDKLNKKKLKYKQRLSKIVNAVSTLHEDNQRIICYRYFENLTYAEIAIRVSLSVGTISRRLKTLLLDLGRIMFGFEDDFWNEVFIDDES